MANLSAIPGSDPEMGLSRTEAPQEMVTGSSPDQFYDADTGLPASTNQNPAEDICKKAAVKLRARNHKSMITKMMLLLLSFLCIMACLVASLTLFTFHMGGIEAWKWLMLLLVVPLSLLVAELVIYCLTMLVLERWFLRSKNVLYYTHGLKAEIAFFVTMVTVICTWYRWLIQPASVSLKKAGEIISHSIICLLVGSFLWVVASILILTLEQSSCLDGLFDRVKESLIHEFIIKSLSGSRRHETGENGNCNDGRENDISDINITELRSLVRQKAPRYAMKLLVDVMRNSTLCYYTVEDRNYKLKTFEHIGNAGAVVYQIQSNAADIGNRDLNRCNLKEFITDDELELVLPMLELNERDMITEEALLRWLERAYKFRAELQRAVANNSKAFKKLKIVCNGVLVFMITVIWLVMVKIVPGNIMIVIFSQIAAAGFIFGKSAKKLFDAWIFLFVTHPFDVGDCCVIEGTPVIIEEISILTTTASKFDKEMAYYPNSALSNMIISNYSRNPHTGDSLEFFVDLATPSDKIDLLKEEIKGYFERNKHLWKPEHSVAMKEFDVTDKIKVAISFNHTISFREFTLRSDRKSTLISELLKIFHRLKISADVVNGTTKGDNRR